MKILRIVSRIVIGLVFIFSGIVKAIDPLGSAYKFHDYFQAFNLGFLNNLSLTLAILLSTIEFLAGFTVLTSIRQKTGIRMVLILLVVFTPLTLILALTNPVSDCGCFGDAIHITNWQTFWKNIVLCGLLVILYSGLNQIKSLLNRSVEWTAISILGALFIIFSLSSLRYLPAIDFLPYKKGIKIADKMVIPPGAETDKYITTFIYEKNGVRKNFDLSNYPANDTTWKFIDQKSVLVKKGYKPPIHDLIISSLDGEDLTQKILTYTGYSVLMITNKLGEAGKKKLDTGFKLGHFFNDTDINFYVLTSSGTQEARKIDNGLNFCSADETTLKTMVRSNPGYMLLKDGVIVGKWSWANVPEVEWFGKLLVAKREDGPH